MIRFFLGLIYRGQAAEAKPDLYPSFCMNYGTGLKGR